MWIFCQFDWLSVHHANQDISRADQQAKSCLGGRGWVPKEPHMRVFCTHECFRNHHLNKSAILLSRVLSEKGNFRLANIAITNLSDAASGSCII